MSTTSASRSRPAAGRLDPTVRGLLRVFLSPAVADRYASALQPVAVADRDAAIAGAVSALRARFEVPVADIAIALVEDTGWDVHDAATLLGLPVATVRDRLAHPDAVRLRSDAPTTADPSAPAEDGVDVDEQAAVDAMLAGMPRRRVEAALAPSPRDEEVQVELSTSLPAYVGLPSLEERFARADRLQRRVVNGIAVAIVLLVGFTIEATAPDEPAQDVADTVDLGPALGDPDPEDDGQVVPLDDDDPFDGVQQPGEGAPPAIAVGTPVIGSVLFTDSIDPRTGEPGATLDTAGVDQDVRAHVTFTQLPGREVLVRLTFSGPDASQTVRPVLLPEGLTTVAVRLPSELGRAPGRYQVVVEAEGADPAVATVTLAAG